MGGPTHNLSGCIFGRLFVWTRAPSGGGGAVRWDCLCICGSFTTVYARCLIRGSTRSCGCLAKEQATARLEALKPDQRLGRRTHGESQGRILTAEFRTWVGMIKRCYQKTSKTYPNYGGRGIRICKRWRGPGGYEAFLADMGRKPGPKWSIDRVDNNAGYSPGNCRWATAKQQVKNRRPRGTMLDRGMCPNGHFIFTEADYRVTKAGAVICRHCRRYRDAKKNSPEIL